MNFSIARLYRGNRENPDQDSDFPTRTMDGGGFEPPKQFAADLQSVPFGHSGIHPYTLILLPEPMNGLEPLTC